MEWLKDWLTDEWETFIGLFVVLGGAAVAVLFGMFFGGIGDKVFGKKKKKG